MNNHIRKALLPVAMVSLPLSAAAELAPLEDEFLGEMTGQAGVSIELETRVTMDEFRYTDEGSISVKDIVFGGADKNTFFESVEFASGYGKTISSINPTNKLDDMRIDIDVTSRGDLVINMGATSTCVGCVGTDPVDFGLSFSSLDLVSQDGSVSSSIIENFSMTGYFTSAFMNITNNGSNGEINAKVSFAIDDLDMDIPLMGVGIEDMYIAGEGFHEDLEFGAFDIANSGAIVRMNIKTEDLTSPSGTVTDALAISLYGNGGAGDALVMDIGIGAVNIGGTSIGSFKIDDLALHDHKMWIYGH